MGNLLRVERIGRTVMATSDHPRPGIAHPTVVPTNFVPEGEGESGAIEPETAD
jgi:hypothetical protein